MPELCSAVVLAQLEHADELVQRRIDVANLFGEKMESVSWLSPQAVPEGYVHSYWTLAVQLDTDRIPWHTFRRNGGDGIYSAWKLTYMEPMFQKRMLEGREIFFKEPFHNVDFSQYRDGLCPVAEKLQKRMLQFKTNYWNWEDAERQADILEQTIKELNDK